MALRIVKICDTGMRQEVNQEVNRDKIMEDKVLKSTQYKALQ